MEASRFEPSRSDIEILRRWIGKVPYLPDHFDDHILAAFIRAAKGSVERAKEVFDNFCRARVKYPEMYKDLNPISPSQQTHMKTLMQVPLPKKTPDGAVVIVIKVINSDPHLFQPINMYRQIGIIMELLLLSDELGASQLVLVFLNDDVTMDHVVKFTPRIISSSLDAVMTAAPARLKAIHTVGTPAFGEWLLTLAKSLLKSKIAQRCHSHKSAASLLNWYPKEILPLELGGEEESLYTLNSKFRGRLEQCADLFIEHEHMMRKYDELRPKCELDVAVGTLKKLDID